MDIIKNTPLEWGGFEGTGLSWNELSENEKLIIVANAAIAASDAHRGAELDRIAKEMHYPECWDTASYPTIYDAIYEMAACSEHPADAEVREKMAWRDIASAPRDGTKILAIVDGDITTVRHEYGEWNLLVCGNYCDSANVGLPQFWMPLPTPPQQEKPE